MIERMDELIKINMSILRLMSKYTNLSYEDIKQTACCAYCFNPDIDKHFLERDIKSASKILRREYARLIKYENAFGVYIKENKRVEKLMNRICREHEEEYTIEDELFTLSDEDTLKAIKEYIGEDNYKFIIKYYEVGNSRCADIYGLSESNCRSRISRLIAKIRNNKLQHFK